MKFQNERQRNGFWFAATQDFSVKDNLSIGWAHAGEHAGRSGRAAQLQPDEHPKTTANMYTIAWKHSFDKQLYWYFDAAETVNHGNAHYDLGAGGHGVTTDCHDGTTRRSSTTAAPARRRGAAAIRSAFRQACTTPSESGRAEGRSLGNARAGGMAPGRYVGNID